MPRSNFFQPPQFSDPPPVGAPKPDSIRFCFSPSEFLGHPDALDAFIVDEPFTGRSVHLSVSFCLALLAGVRREVRTLRLRSSGVAGPDRDAVSFSDLPPELFEGVAREFQKIFRDLP